MLRIVRHPLGPRVYVAGIRIHECYAGLVASCALLAAELTDHASHRPFEAGVGVVATWMMAKDWPDFFPSRRDTYAWRIGVHRRGE